MTFPEFARPRIHGWLRMSAGLCGDWSLAEDLVQDVLIKVHARWDYISAMESPDGYIHRMLTNEFLSWRRKWGRVVPSDHVHIDLPPSQGDARADQHADRDALLGELSKLPPRQRAVLVLRYFNAMTDAEIADVLGCATGTVRGYAARALATLRVEPAASLLRAEGI